MTRSAIDVTSAYYQTSPGIRMFRLGHDRTTRSPIGIWWPSAWKSGPIASGETSAKVTFPSSYSTQRSLELGFRSRPSVWP